MPFLHMGTLRFRDAKKSAECHTAPWRQLLGIRPRGHAITHATLLSRGVHSPGSTWMPWGGAVAGACIELRQVTLTLPCGRQVTGTEPGPLLLALHSVPPPVPSLKSLPHSLGTTGSLKSPDSQGFVGWWDEGERKPCLLPHLLLSPLSPPAAPRVAAGTPAICGRPRDPAREE